MPQSLSIILTGFGVGWIGRDANRELVSAAARCFNATPQIHWEEGAIGIPEALSRIKQQEEKGTCQMTTNT